jgi:hypothetical protein
MPINIYIDYDDDIKKVMHENTIDIVEILKNNKIESQINYGTLPYKLKPGVQDKEIVTIILASSAAIVSIGFAISMVLREIYYRPHIIEFYENEDLKSLEGNPCLDENENPIIIASKKYELVQPQKKDMENIFEFNLDLKKGVLIKFVSRENG